MISLSLLLKMYDSPLSTTLRAVDKKHRILHTSLLPTSIQMI